MTFRTSSLVGRQAELAHIAKSISAGRGLLFAGRAGVGKTRLLRETKTLLEERGFDVIEIIGAQATADLPLAPLLSLVDLDQEGDLARLVLSALTRRARDHTVAMLVDDIQLLDEASASLVHRVALAGLALVFATHRSNEQLAPAAESLWKDGHIDRVEIPPISRSEQERLASLMVGKLDSSTQRWLWETALGHPLFLRELLVDATINERTTTTAAGISIPRPDALPRQLVALVSKNVVALEPDARRAMDFVAIGGRVDASIVGALTSASAVRELIDMGVCRKDGKDLTPAHPLFAETATAGLTDDALSALRVELAQAIDDAGGNLMQSTLLRIAAGSRVDEEQLRSAFAIAIRARQPSTTQTIGVALSDQTDDPMVIARTAFAFAQTRDWANADALFERAVAVDNDHDADEVYLIWLQAAFEYRADPAEAMALAADVVANTSGPANQMARALQYRVRMFFEPMQPILEERSNMLDESLDPRAEAMVRLDQATVAWRMLKIPLQQEMLGSVSLDDMETLNEIRVRQVQSSAMVWRHGPKSIGQELVDVRPTLLEIGDADAKATLEVATVISNSEGLNTTRALQAFASLDKLKRRATDQRYRPLSLGYELFNQSRTPGFDQRADDLVALAESADPSVYALSGAYIYLVASRAARRDGGSPGALRQKAIEVARWRGEAIAELFALRDEYAFGDPATPQTVDRLQELAHRVGPGLAQLYADEAAAHLTKDADRLAELSFTAEEIGAYGLAWDLTAAAQRFFGVDGDGANALRAERRSQRLAMLDPLAHSPLHALMAPVLSDREQEVAALVSSGLSNPQVASELYLSPRTVGRHLERIYAKLNISSRRALREVLDSCESIPSGPSSG